MRRRRNWSTKRPTRWSQRLSQHKDIFHSIEQPKGGDFFAQNGLLFESVQDLAPQMKMLTQAQRLVQVLAGDPSLRGVIQTLQFGLLGVQGGQITLDNMAWPMTLAANTIEKVNAGQPASFSWHEMVEGRASTPDELLRFLEIGATLDYSELEPGKRATDAIRQAAADLDIASKYQARLRLTGPVPMADEEFATIKENAVLNATRDDRHRACHPVAGAALDADHLRGVRLPCRRPYHHGGCRHADGRHAQSDIGLFCRAVRRARRRFRPAIQRPLSRRAARGRQCARGAACRPAGAPARR